MVKILSEKTTKGLELNFYLGLSFVALLAVVTTWLMISYMFDETIREILYPYSHYPVIVYSAGEIISFPAWVVLWLLTLLGVNHILLTRTERTIFINIKDKLLKCVSVVLAIAVLLLVLEYLGWPIVASDKGYTSCPYGTLLSGQKTSTAWVKDVSLCYDKEVIKRFPTGSYDQVLDVAKYLGKTQ